MTTIIINPTTSSILKKRKFKRTKLTYSFIFEKALSEAAVDFSKEMGYKTD